jgi:hypothetical protein
VSKIPGGYILKARKVAERKLAVVPGWVVRVCEVVRGRG